MLAAGTIKSARDSLIGPGDSNTLWRRVVEPVEPFLAAVADQLEAQVDTFDPEIVPFARYALTNQGKQLRPALVALSATAVGEIKSDVITAAVIIEMIHLATLVHDDIVDDAELRRSRPTLAANWGKHVSVLLGDCLFAHALRLASGFPTTEVCRAVSAATKTVCSGEILQTLKRTRNDRSRDEYFRILQMKTAELFALSCDLGSWLGGATPRQRQSLRQFGMELGTAYQVFDDCVDLFGSEADAGKSLGTDLASGKLTLPILIVLERAPAKEANKIQESLISRPQLNGELLHAFERYHALQECRDVIRQFLARACDALDPLPPNPSRQALAELCAFLAKQTEELGVKETG